MNILFKTLPIKALALACCVVMSTVNMHGMEEQSTVGQTFIATIKHPITPNAIASASMTILSQRFSPLISSAPTLKNLTAMANGWTEFLTYISQLIPILEETGFSPIKEYTIDLSTLNPVSGVIAIIKRAAPAASFDFNDFETIVKQPITDAVTRLTTAINHRENPEQVEQYKQGKEAIIKYLLGVVMRETKGKADPSATEKLLKESH